LWTTAAAAVQAALGRALPGAAGQVEVNRGSVAGLLRRPMGGSVTMAPMDSQRPEVFVSVDIEASGPSPSTGSMLSIGACLVSDPARGLYLELKPLPDRPWDDDAARIHGLDRLKLERGGLEADVAMARFAAWLAEASAGAQPVFVGFNAPFDWMFVADYFWRYLGRNPFGISGLDLKSLFMARAGVSHWAETTRTHVDRWLGLDKDHNHHALDDARGQARVARALLELDSTKSRPGVEN
jgi:ribonuclease T